MPYKIESTSNLLFKKVTKIQTDINRKIEWIGFLTNSTLDEKLIPCENLNYNENNYGILSKITFPVQVAV